MSNPMDAIPLAASMMVGFGLAGAILYGMPTPTVDAEPVHASPPDPANLPECRLTTVGTWAGHADSALVVYICPWGPDEHHD